MQDHSLCEHLNIFALFQPGSVNNWAWGHQRYLKQLLSWIGLCIYWTYWALVFAVFIFCSCPNYIFPRNSVLTCTLRIVSIFIQTKYKSGSLILSTLDQFTTSPALIQRLQFLDSCLLPRMLGTEFLPHTLDTLKWN